LPEYRKKIGSNLRSAISGVSHGVVDFVLNSIHDLQTAATYMGAGELELNVRERVQIIEAVEQSQASRMATIEGWMTKMLSANPADPIYQGSRSTTTMGLEIGSLVTGGYGAVKGVMAFHKLARASQQVSKVSNLSAKILKSKNGFLGHKGFEIKNAKYQKVRNNPATIRSHSYSGHSLDQMQNRGFTPSVVEETIQSGIGVPNKVTGRTQFYDPVNNISVVTENGEVITVVYGRLN
jgi:hypothetical protein